MHDQVMDYGQPPVGWTIARLADICRRIIGGGTPPTVVQRYWSGQIPWISSADIYGLKDIRPRRKISNEAIINSATNILHKGGIVVVTRVGLGKLAIAPFDLCFSQDSQGLELCNALVLGEYALLCLSRAVQTFKHASRGTTINGVTKKQLENVQIPLPPLREQHRVVAKIEELLSELDKAVESLKTAQQQLKIYRQAVLQRAFVGKLTEKWRTEQKNLRTASQLLDDIKHDREEHAAATGRKLGGTRPLTEKELIGLPVPPKGWSWVKIETLLENGRNAIKAGPFGSSLKKEHYVNEGYKVYGQEQVISQDPYHGNYFISDEKYNSLISNKVKPGDILISLVGTIGNILILPDNAKPGIINPRLIKVSLDPKRYLATFFKCYFESSLLKKKYATESQGTTMDILNMSIIKELPFPLLCIEEQAKIVEEIESRFSVTDKLEEAISLSFQQADALRQSILKRAFEGKLVPQDPNDEPADKLLERIKADRAKQAPQKKTRKKRERHEQ